MKEKIISLVNLVSLFFQKLFLLMIRFYQAAISPHLGKNCRFTPTCSQYAYIAITRFGPIKGTYLAIKRLLKCHPFHAGGYDPVPEKKEKILGLLFAIIVTRFHIFSAFNSRIDRLLQISRDSPLPPELYRPFKSPFSTENLNAARSYSPFICCFLYSHIFHNRHLAKFTTNV